MNDILNALMSALDSGQRPVFTCLVETRGSTPQKAGAAMLVYADGRQIGTLGGGCVEAEVKRRALQLAVDGRAELLTFQLDKDYGWDDGLICGGRMTMLVDPAAHEAGLNYFRRYQEMVPHGCTEAVVIDPQKAGGRPGSRLLFDRAGALIAYRDGDPRLTPAEEGELVEHVRSHLKPLCDRPRPYVAGGVSYLPQLPRCRLVVVGAGHVGQQVAEYAAQVDFDVWVIDDRAEYCNRERFPRAQRLIVGSIEDTLAGLEVDQDSFCIIVTRGHNHDEQALFHLVNRPMRYLGMIGSKRKIKMIYEDLRQLGISQQALDRVHAPIGFDIGSQTVPEIAISIAAQLIQVRNLGRG